MFVRFFYWSGIKSFFLFFSNTKNVLFYLAGKHYGRHSNQKCTKFSFGPCGSNAVIMLAKGLCNEFNRVLIVSTPTLFLSCWYTYRCLRQAGIDGVFSLNDWNSNTCGVAVKRRNMFIYGLVCLAFTGIDDLVCILRIQDCRWGYAYFVLAY